MQRWIPSLSSIKGALPWQARLGAKLVLSRVPARYHLWQRLQLFRHGQMDDPGYASRVFCAHLERSSFPRKDGGFTCLELGPGDSLFTALLARAYGADQTFLVDAGPFAREEVAPYQAMARFLREQGRPLEGVEHATSLSQVLQAVNGQYLTEGLRSLQQLPEGSVDFIFSHAVLEHIRLEEFQPTMQALRRVLRPGGISSHRVDLQDHLGGALNNLRFSRATWEADWMTRSGFYTNRIRFSPMLKHFEQAGFAVEVLGAERWQTSPTPRRSLAPEFQTLSEDDLLVSGFDVLLRPDTLR